MLCTHNSPINFFIIEIEFGQVCLIGSMSLYVTRKGDVLLRVNLSKVDSRECILLAVADKNCGRMSPLRKIRFYTSCQPLHQFKVYLSAFQFCLPATIFYTKLSGYFALLSSAFFLIADVLSFIKIDYGTLKSSQMEDFMQTNNPSPY